MMLQRGNNTIYNPASDCEKVVELGKLGYSKAQIASELEISRETVRLWEKKYTAFHEAMQLAMTHSQAWWEKTGQNALYVDKFQAAVWNKSVTARFREDYGDRVENTLKNAPSEVFKVESLTPEEAARIYNQLLEDSK